MSAFSIDNGGGMTPERMRECMSLGFSTKSKSGNTIGQCKSQIHLCVILTAGQGIQLILQICSAVGRLRGLAFLRVLVIARVFFANVSGLEM